MLKIKEIHFDKTPHDVLPTHHVFSTASVYFTNAEPIHGAFLYWQQNTTADDYTTEGDYKFYYEMSQTQFFASVRFPESANLSAEERKELAFILLEERGYIGSYSVESSKAVLKKLMMKKQLADFVFPAHFQANDFSPFLTANDRERSLLEETYEPQFITDYLQWRKQTALFHPEDIQPFITFIGIPYLGYANPYVSELFLIEHLHEIDFEALQHNVPVLHRLSPVFRQHLLEMLQKSGQPLVEELQVNPDGFASKSRYFDLDSEQIAEDEEEALQPYAHFEYERTLFEWPGAEHMVKGIPSLASQLYDAEGYIKRTNQQMDTLMQTFDAKQIQLFSAIAELHWLNRYRELIDWHIASRSNANLNDVFLTRFEPYIVTEQLALNTLCHVSQLYLIEHMEQFKPFQPAPLVVSHLTAPLFHQFQDELKLSLDVLYDYYDYMSQQDFEVIFDILSQEQAQ